MPCMPHGRMNAENCVIVSIHIVCVYLRFVHVHWAIKSMCAPTSIPFDNSSWACTLHLLGLCLQIMRLGNKIRFMSVTTLYQMRQQLPAIPLTLVWRSDENNDRSDNNNNSQWQSSPCLNGLKNAFRRITHWNDAFLQIWMGCAFAHTQSLRFF